MSWLLCDFDYFTLHRDIYCILNLIVVLKNGRVHKYGMFLLSCASI